MSFSPRVVYKVALISGDKYEHVEFILIQFQDKMKNFESPCLMKFSSSAFL